MSRWSFARFWGVVLKEFLQLARERITFGMILGVPIAQLLLFGYAINTDPKNLPTAIIAADHSEFTRSYVAAMKTTGYFDIIGELPNEEAGRAALARGDVQFVLNIPTGFTRDLLRGEHPSMLLEADATDPTAIATAVGTVQPLVSTVAAKDAKGLLANLSSAQGPAFDVRVHKLYNPEGITNRNIVPSLMGVILSMTMVMMTGLAITRERERGTMENLLATPVNPLEVMTGKIVPYIFIGLIQSTIILVAARYLFGIPVVGSVVALYIVILLFVAANLTVGITLSSLAQNQLQAMQLTFFYFLPGILLSGFMFPFRGMPTWAQVVGSVVPMTYFNRLIRGIFLKGNTFPDLWPDLWPLIAFTVVVMGIAVRTYRRTLD
jgi:ABC-2 type transport system permease protein